jgi:hypothetical protein
MNVEPHSLPHCSIIFKVVNDSHPTAKTAILTQFASLLSVERFISNLRYNNGTSRSRRAYSISLIFQKIKYFANTKIRKQASLAKLTEENMVRLWENTVFSV